MKTLLQLSCAAVLALLWVQAGAAISLRRDKYPRPGRRVKQALTDQRPDAAGATVSMVPAVSVAIAILGLVALSAPMRTEAMAATAEAFATGLRAFARIEAHMARTGRMPSNVELQPVLTPLHTERVQHISFAPDGTISLVLRGKPWFDGKTVVLTKDGRCFSPDLPTDYLPQGCR